MIRLPCIRKFSVGGDLIWEARELSQQRGRKVYPHFIMYGDRYTFYGILCYKNQIIDDKKVRDIIEKDGWTPPENVKSRLWID